MEPIIVFVGAGIGGVARYFVNVLALRLLGSSFPYGTLAVNVLGGLLMGIVAELWVQKMGWPQPLRLLLTTGFMGGFTTFSTFSLDTAYLWERGEGLAAAGYVLASVVLSIGALFTGLWLVRAALAGVHP